MPPSSRAHGARCLGSHLHVLVPDGGGFAGHGPRCNRATTAHPRVSSPFCQDPPADRGPRERRPTKSVTPRYCSEAPPRNHGETDLEMLLIVRDVHSATSRGATHMPRRNGARGTTSSALFPMLFFLGCVGVVLCRLTPVAMRKSVSQSPDVHFFAQSTRSVKIRIRIRSIHWNNTVMPTINISVA